MIRKISCTPRTMNTLLRSRYRRIRGVSREWLATHFVFGMPNPSTSKWIVDYTFFMSNLNIYISTSYVSSFSKKNEQDRDKRRGESLQKMIYSQQKAKFNTTQETNTKKIQLTHTLNTLRVKLIVQKIWKICTYLKVGFLYWSSALQMPAAYKA